jgi:hypothetical protein
MSQHYAHEIVLQRQLAAAGGEPPKPVANRGMFGALWRRLTRADRPRRHSR